MNSIDTGSGAVWFTIRWNDNNNLAQAGYDHAVDAWVIRQKVSGIFTTLGSAAASISTGIWYPVKVAASGGNIELIVDGVSKVSVTNCTKTSSGRSALYSHKADAYFDDICQ